MFADWTGFIDSLHIRCGGYTIWFNEFNGRIFIEMWEDWIVPTSNHVFVAFWIFLACKIGRRSGGCSRDTEVC